MSQDETGHASDADRSVRPAAVAGTFYPEDPATLRDTVLDLLPETEFDERFPKALIAPHAGYIYSGIMAGRAYALLRHVSERVRRVVLIGPAHRRPVDGLALPGVDAFATPLGEVTLDPDLVERVSAMPQVSVSPDAHAREHSLEVHLPFLQQVLADFTLLPLLVGDASPDAVAEVLGEVWGGPETVVVISSDLSHFLAYDEAMKVDAATAVRIKEGATDLVGEQACGCRGINGLNVLVEPKDLSIMEIGRMNSGDSAGDHSRVVGYGAWAYYQHHFRR
jgi:MEMO1 family protein